MPERLVIIGGIAAGMTAAVWARRQSTTIDITVIERGEDVSYSECGMPYVFSGEVHSLNDLIRYRPEQLQQRYNIKILNGCNVETVNTATQSLTIRNLRNKEDKKLYFDYLVLAMGAEPKPPDVAGSYLPGVFTLRHMPGAQAINNYLKSSLPHRAVVVGGSLLGLEMAAALRQRGLEVILLEQTDTLLKTLSPNLQLQLHQELNKHGIDVRFNQTVMAINGRTQVEEIITSAGKIETDMLLFAIGVIPNTTLAEMAGVRLGASGAIAVKDTQQTNIPFIYAAGDCCEAYHLVSERPSYIPLGTTANKQGRVAGINIAGGRAQFKGVVGTMALQVFDLAIATTGLCMATAQAAGFNPAAMHSHSISRAGYYPGATPIDTEIIYDQHTGRLLGAQMLGVEGVAKRIDVFATALYARLRLEDIIQLDLSYAPPFAPVWDPILYTVRKIPHK